MKNLYSRHQKAIAFAAGCAAALLLAALLAAFSPAPRTLTEKDLDAAVQRALRERPLPSPAARAYAAVRRAIVRVRAIGDGLEGDEYLQKALGSGVLIVDEGLVLTSLHVVSGASRVRLQFADGSESDARIVAARPESDLAVLRAQHVPEGVAAATLGAPSSLAEGDHVTAVGFPFGIGPSVTAGVVSGLKRDYHAPEGGRVLSDLIQFDAAVNPGSSGGALVNAAGELVGIVTAILSPAGNGAFAGVAFAVPIDTAAAAAGLPPF